MTEARWKPSVLIKATFGLHLVTAAALVWQPGYWKLGLWILLANHALLMLLGLWPRSALLGQNWTRLPADARARNEIALTFDDGPDPLVTPKILEILDEQGCRATFFCIGEKAARYPDLCRQIAQRGHAVENHSHQHAFNFGFLGLAGLKRELGESQDTLQAITSQRPLFFRAPAGMRSPLLDPALAYLGVKLASWSVRGFDTWSRNPERVNRRLQKGLKAGAIVLLHDGNSARTRDGDPVVLKVLPGVLDAARAKGLRCVTLRHALSVQSVR